MPSSYTTSLRLTLPATGELTGTWGTTVNTGITELLDSAVAGTTTISTWGGAGVAYTLSNTDGAADEARKMFIVATGAPGEAKNVICPAVSKLYFFRNDTTGGFALTLKTSGGSGIAVPAGQYKVLYCDGTNVVEAFNSLASLTLGTALAASSGGTGQSTYTTGDLLYASGASALSKLGIGTNGQVLTSTGTAPQWSTLSGVAVTTFSAGTTGFTPSTATSGAVTLAGTLATTNGGTGLTSFTANRVFYASSTSAVGQSANLTFDGTTLTANALNLSGGTANGVLYLDGSKVATSGSGFTFASSVLTIDGGSGVTSRLRLGQSGIVNWDIQNTASTGVLNITNGAGSALKSESLGAGLTGLYVSSGGEVGVGGAAETGIALKSYGAVKVQSAQPIYYMNSDNTNNVQIANAGATGASNGQMTFTLGGVGEQMRLTSTGLGIGVNPSTSLGTSMRLFVNGASGGGIESFYNNLGGFALVPPSTGAGLIFYTFTGGVGAESYSEQMRLTSTGLGIGTSSPASKLTVNGDVLVTNANYYLSYTSALASVRMLGINAGNVAYIGPIDSGPTSAIFNASSTVTQTDWYNSGSSAMTLTSTGLGIGTSSPAQKLVVSNAGAQGFEFDPSTGIFQVYNRGTSAYGEMRPYASQIRFFTGSSPVETMRLDSSGNLGIGTSSPGYRLTVAGASTAGSVTALAIENPSTNAASEVRQEWRAGGSSWAYITASYNSNSPYMAFGVSAASASPTERMRLDSSGNLGIGTSSVSAKLQAVAADDARVFQIGGSTYALRASSSTSIGGILLQGVDGTGSVSYQPLVLGGSILQFLTNGTTEAARIDSSGNLGLGVTPSAWGSSYRALQVGGSGISAWTTSASGGNLYLSNNTYFDGTNRRYIANAVATEYEAGSVGHVWKIAPSGTAGNAISFTQAMTLTAAGRLGVGLTAPNYTFETAFDAAVTAGSCTALLSAEGGVQGSVGTTTNHALLLKTNNTERARITSGGDLLVGTTSTTMGQTGVTIIPALGGQVGYIQIGHANGAASGNGYADFFYNAVSIGSITQNGTTAVAFNTTSDRRLKQNIVPAPSASDVIDAIQIVSHDWKSAPDEHVTYGVIAQDLALVAPQAVLQGDDGDEIEKTWGVDYSKLVPMLIKEIQSLRARVAALESQP